MILNVKRYNKKLIIIIIIIKLYYAKKFKHYIHSKLKIGENVDTF